MDKVRMMTAVGVLAAAGATAFWAVPGVAATAGSPSAQSSYQTWKRDDACAKRAFELNPDYTREGIAAREKYIRTCEMQTRTPVRDRLAPASRPQQ